MYAVEDEIMTDPKVIAMPMKMDDSVPLFVIENTNAGKE